MNIDFNSFVWVRQGGNVVIDPLPLRPYDAAHLRDLGGDRYCLIINDHLRAAAALVDAFGPSWWGRRPRRLGSPSPAR